MFKKWVAKWLIIILFTITGEILPGVVGDAVKKIPTPGTHPTAMTFDGKNIWIADKSTAKLYCINPLNGKVIHTIETPGFDPRGLAWDGQLLWCLDREEGWIYGINPKKGIAEHILESNSPNAGGLVFDGSFLWMIDSRANKILKINRRDGMMHESIPAPSAHVNDLAFDGNYIWATDNVDNMLYRLDPTNGDVVTYISSNGPYPYGICWDGKTLWNADYQNTEIYKLDLTSREYMSKKNPKMYQWEIVQEFRNYGSGEVVELDIYIAVPKDMDNQTILGKIIFEPKPKSFVIDKWGQKFAQFHFSNISSGKILRVKLKLKARLFQTEYYILPERVGSLKDIPKNLEKFLKDGFKYDIKNPIIQNAVKKAMGDEDRPYWIMRKIFNHIISKIDYNLKPLGGWNPAPTVLKRGTGSCSEYTFVFIAMCRAAGLPTRYVGSVVVRSKDKGEDHVWHRWPEVYLPNYGWIPADPSAEGHRPFPGGKARLIGSGSNRYLITTVGGGDSEYLDSYYNFNARWKTRGKCKIVNKAYGEYTPIIKTTEK